MFNNIGTFSGYPFFLWPILINCRILWNYIADNIVGAEFRLDRAPVLKACLDNPALNDMKYIVVAFKSYHALRFGHREMVLKAIRTDKFDSVHAYLLEYLWCFASEQSLRHYAS